MAKRKAAEIRADALREAADLCLKERNRLLRLVRQAEDYAKTHSYQRYDDIDIGSRIEAEVLATAIEALGASPRDKKYKIPLEFELPVPKHRKMDLK